MVDSLDASNDWSLDLDGIQDVNEDFLSDIVQCSHSSLDIVEYSMLDSRNRLHDYPESRQFTNRDQYSDDDLLLESEVDFAKMSSRANGISPLPTIFETEEENWPPSKKIKNGQSVVLPFNENGPDSLSQFYRDISHRNFQLEWRLFLLRVPKFISNAMNICDFDGIRKIIDQAAAKNCILIPPNMHEGIVGRQHVTEMFTAIMETYPDAVMVFKRPKFVDGAIEFIYVGVGTKLGVHPNEALFCGNHAEINNSFFYRLRTKVNLCFSLASITATYSQNHMAQGVFKFELDKTLTRIVKVAQRLTMSKCFLSSPRYMSFQVTMTAKYCRLTPIDPSMITCKLVRNYH